MVQRNGATPPTVRDQDGPHAPQPSKESQVIVQSCGKVQEQAVWGDRHKAVVRQVIFETLAKLARRALEAAGNATLCATHHARTPPTGPHLASLASARGDMTLNARAVKSCTEGCEDATNGQTSRTSDEAGSNQAATVARPAAALGTSRTSGAKRRRQGGVELPESHGRAQVFLFNEQYVVKPPRSTLEFGWHTVSLRPHCSGGKTPYLTLAPANSWLRNVSCPLQLQVLLRAGANVVLSLHMWRSAATYLLSPI